MYFYTYFYSVLFYFLQMLVIAKIFKNVKVISNIYFIPLEQNILPQNTNFTGEEGVFIL